MRFAFDVVSAMSIFTVWWLNNEMNQCPLRWGTRLALGFLMLMLSMYVGSPDHYQTWHEISQNGVSFVMLALGAIQVYAGLVIGAVDVWNWVLLISSESGNSIPDVLSAAPIAFLKKTDRSTRLEFLLFGGPLVLCFILEAFSPHFLRGVAPSLDWVAAALLWAWIVYGYIPQRRPPESKPKTTTV